MGSSLAIGTVGVRTLVCYLRGRADRASAERRSGSRLTHQASSSSLLQGMTCPSYPPMSPTPADGSCKRSPVAGALLVTLFPDGVQPPGRRWCRHPDALHQRRGAGPPTCPSPPIARHQALRRLAAPV